MKFRYDIGFLRAFSVLIVLFYHFKIPFFSGGFTGVDIFFVISGFLMTKIIVKGLVNNDFNFKNFYVKRAIRIIPALLFLLIFVLIISCILFLTSDLRLNSKYVFLSGFFISNIYFWLFSGYFDPSSHTNILLHTWSLSVEWQFYMLYPLLLWPMRTMIKKNIKKFTVIFVLFTTLSFILMLFLTNDYNSFSFYMFPTRAWEMTLGGLASLLNAENILKNTSLAIRKIVVLISYVVLCVCNVFIDESFIWPSAYTLIVVFPVFIILLFNVEFAFLRNKIVQFVGNISYSLYLWHWPLYLIFKYFGYTDKVSIIILIILSFIFASISYYFVETNKKVDNLKVISIALCSIALISMTLFLKPSNKIVQSMSIYKKEVLNLGDYKTDNPKEWKQQFNPCGCFVTQDLKLSDYNTNKCLNISKIKKNILLIGDSHAAQFSASLREKLPDYNMSEVSASYTFPLLNPRGKEDSKFLMNKVFTEFIENNSANIDIIVISTHWLMYRNGSLGYKREDLKENILNTLAYIKSKNIKVYFLGQTETYTMPYPKILMLNLTFGKTLDKRYLDIEAEDLNNYFKTFIPSDVYIDIYNQTKIKYDSNNKIPYMFDDNHLTRFGADQIVEILKKSIRK